MLDSDELPEAETAAQAMRDRPVSEYWDGDKRYGAEIARSLGMTGWTAWDVYLFYPPGATWTDAGMPRPEAALAQAGGVVVATKGTLPAVVLDNELPPAVRAAADIVGNQTDFDALLGQVVAPFAARYAR
jgi:hypothetical protein